MEQFYPLFVVFGKSGQSSIRKAYIEKNLSEKELDLTATIEVKAAYSVADFVVTAVPTNV